MRGLCTSVPRGFPSSSKTVESGEALLDVAGLFYYGVEEQRMSLVLKSVEEEAAACRERCAGMKVGDVIVLCHHDTLFTTPTWERGKEGLCLR